MVCFEEIEIVGGRREREERKMRKGKGKSRRY
jgi:hypothetical protein